MKNAFVKGLLIFGCCSMGAWLALSRPRGQITFIVKTDAGEIVSDPEVVASVFHHWQPGEGFGKDVQKEFRGRTDADGKAVIKLRSSRNEIKYWASAGGSCYRTLGSYRFEEQRGGRWQPWNPTVNIVLKPILNPIPMYARRLGDLPFRIPERASAVGFDLVASDWVQPFGSGDIKDFIFRMEASSADGTKPYRASLALTFLNDGDGIQEIPGTALVGSGLKLPRHAPAQGYSNTWERLKSRTELAVNDGRQEHAAGYFFRVRSVTNEKGEIVSALYGRIDGAIEFWPNGSLRFTYYLNPTPNDRNMEWDPKRNLLSGLKSYESPNAP